MVPAGLLRRRIPSVIASDEFTADAASRAEVERLAMEAVMAAERRLGFEPVDVSAENRGWDIESRRLDGGPLRLLEVKGRHAQARTVTITRNELFHAKNKPDGYRLVIVRVEEGRAREPVYVRDFADREPGFAEASVNLVIDELTTRACDPAA